MCSGYSTRVVVCRGSYYPLPTTHDLPATHDLHTTQFGLGSWDSRGAWGV